MPQTESASVVVASGEDLEEIQRRRSARGIHKFEVALVALALVNLCVLPWAFGGVDPACEVASALVSLCALGVAVLPRHSEDEVTGLRRKLLMAPRLFRFPVFWAGLAVLAYAATQAANPAYAYRILGTSWWLETRPHIGWIPSGMETPFADMNPWRVIAIWGSVWALTCALWVGITRRSAIQAILVGLEVNAFAFAAFGIVQRAHGAAAIYGERPVGHPDFMAAFIYRNHAAAYFSLLASVAIGLTIKAIWKGRKHMDPSGRGIIHLLLALTLIVALALTGSFAATGLFVAMAALLVPFVLWRYTLSFRGTSADRPLFVGGASLVILAVGLGAYVGYGGIRDRVDSIESGGGQTAARIRLLVDKRGLEMLGDRWALGWGAGSFRYGFTKYQKREPALARVDGLPVHWEHAHDDWLELPIELGVAGMIPVAFIAGFWVWRIVRLRLWRKLSALPMLGGLLILCLHGFVDFPLQNLAILATAGALTALLVRWGEIETESP